MEESSVLPTLYIVTINKSNYCLSAMSRIVGSLLLFHKCFVSDGTYHCVCDRLFSWLIWLRCITSNVTFYSTFENFVISLSRGENSVFPIFPLLALNYYFVSVLWKKRPVIQNLYTERTRLEFNRTLSTSCRKSCFYFSGRSSCQRPW